MNSVFAEQPVDNSVETTASDNVANLLGADFSNTTQNIETVIAQNKTVSEVHNADVVNELSIPNDDGRGACVLYCISPIYTPYN